MRFNDSKLANVPSMELFLKYWKYGKNWEDSTVLVDPGMNIIAFFDRGTNNIDVIQTDLDTPGGIIYECQSDAQSRVRVISHKKKKTKYVPRWYTMALKEQEKKIKELKGKISGTKNKKLKAEYGMELDNFKADINIEVKKYNRDYFNNLIQYGTQSLPEDKEVVSSGDGMNS